MRLSFGSLLRVFSSFGILPTSNFHLALIRPNVLSLFYKSVDCFCYLLPISELVAKFAWKWKPFLYLSAFFFFFSLLKDILCLCFVIPETATSPALTRCETTRAIWSFDTKWVQRPRTFIYLFICFFLFWNCMACFRDLRGNRSTFPLDWENGIWWFVGRCFTLFLILGFIIINNN